jgi:MFS family permease
MSSIESPNDRAMYRKIAWRIMPLLLTAYVVAFLDRINIGYAQLQMKETLAFSDAVYALGAGVFFIGYLLFEVPSNLMLEKIGVRKTLLRIMVCWGIVAMAMMFVQTPTQFYVLRFLLGAFEAGFTPGALLYLTFWYPPARRAGMIGIFLLGAIVASLIAGPLSGAIMKFLDGLYGWHGWQWLFLVQGLPAPLLGLLAWRVLVDRPEQATWLSPAEKTRLRQQLDAETQSSTKANHGSLRDLLGDARFWALALVYVVMVAGTYAMAFWIPTLIRSWGVSDLMNIGLYATLPQLGAVVGVILLGRSSDRLRPGLRIPAPRFGCGRHRPDQQHRQPGRRDHSFTDQRHQYRQRRHDLQHVPGDGSIPAGQFCHCPGCPPASSGFPIRLKR